MPLHLLLLVPTYQPSQAVRPRTAQRASVVAIAVSGPAEAAATCDRPLSETVQLRPAGADELEAVARLQLDVFVPSAEPPPLLPMLSGIYEPNQRSVRASMRKRLCSDIATRVAKGSDILVAAAPAEEVAPLLTEGAYAEADDRFLGTVDVSSQEVELPTHSLSQGLYLCAARHTPARRATRHWGRCWTHACEQPVPRCLHSSLPVPPRRGGSRGGAGAGAA